MSHTSSRNKPLFIFGTTILSLILIAAITIPLYSSSVFAQDDDKEEEEKEEETKEEDESSSTKEEEEEESSSDSKEEEKEEESNSEEEEQQPKEEEESSNETATEEEPVNTTQQIIPDPIVNLTPGAEEVISTTVAEPIIEKKEFNATCKCMTTGAATDKPKPPTPQPNNPNQAIPLTKADIQDSKSFGEVVDPAYTGFYTVPNLLDAIINDVSFWSQAGKSSFYIKLDNALDSYQVCSMELNVYQPKSTPFLLDVGVSQNYTGVLDQATEKIPFEKCVKNMDEILMIFDSPPNTYVSIGEIKLFGSKLGATTQTPTAATTSPPLLGHPILQPSPSTTTTTENATKINIQDSVAEIDIKNSTVTFKFDPMTATFVQQGTK